MPRVATLLLASLAVWPAICQTKSQSQGPFRIEIGVERKEGGQWRQIDPGLVLNQADHVRFRFRANFEGYLYVLNQGSSGGYSLLYPAEETGRQNHIESGKDYLIPATKGSFQIAGPAGHDISYWLVSPFDLRSEGGTKPHYEPLPPPPAATQPSPPLIPRCDDDLFRTRGDCVDVSAGPRKVGGQVPSNLSGAAAPASRDLTFAREQKIAVISTPVALTGPVIYEFHLAHR